MNTLFLEQYMKKTVIVYSGKYGTTAQCAQALKEALNGADLYCLDVMVHIDLEQYDTVIIGTSIYAGMVRKPIKKFCQDNEAELLEKNLAVFICSATDNTDEYMKTNFSQAFIEKIKVSRWFGGELKLEVMSRFERLIIKLVAKSKSSGQLFKPSLLHEHITGFAQEVLLIEQV